VPAALAASTVRALLAYNRRTGALTWRVARGRVAAGAPAGSWKKRYLYVGLFGETYLAHRVIWLIVTGRWPKQDIDHRDTDSANNRFRNLRDASKTVNMRNRRRSNKNNKLGIVGVCLTPSGRFQARIKDGSKTRHIGLFDTAQAAHRAYIKAQAAM
jgi:hypothetical protein